MREAEREPYLALMDKGIIFAPRTYAKLFRMSPMEFDRMLEEGKYSEWTTNLTSMLQSVYTQSGKNVEQKDAGRPKSNESDISDSGATSRDYE